MKLSIKIILLIIVIFLGGITQAALAKSYDLYVDEDCDESDADGSKDKPFCSISDAIEEASKGDEIYIAEGSYKENVSLPNRIKLIGSSESKVVIEGYVEMDDGSSIESLTVSGSSISVRVKKDASVEIDGCTVKSFTKVGIQTEIGGGSLKVEDSKIRSSKGKGLYIQAGKKIEITGNEIYDNNEEGVDIRANVSGEISNNLIYDNGESGIELIVGKSNLVVKSNSIKNNGASGIANQFYAAWSKTGDISIVSNVLSGNKKYGIDCNIPSKGAESMSAGYWKNSISLSKNKIEKNKLASINNDCSLIKVVDEEEKKANEITESTTAEKEPVTISEEEEIDEKSEEDENIEKRLSSISEEFSLEKGSIYKLVSEMNEENNWKIFLIGHKPEDIFQIESFSEKLVDYLGELESFSDKTGNAELLKDINNLQEKIKTEMITIQGAEQQIKDSFSLFGWLRDINYKLFSK